jgi:hypothetical protein
VCQHQFFRQSTKGFAADRTPIAHEYLPDRRGRSTGKFKGRCPHGIFISEFGGVHSSTHVVAPNHTEASVSNTGNSPKPNRPSSKDRRDTTHPSHNHPTLHRRERRPYPTASRTSHISPAKAAATRKPLTEPTPPTVWASGPVTGDLDTVWPSATVTAVVESFTKSGARVAVVPWPGAFERSRHSEIGTTAADTRATSRIDEDRLTSVVKIVEDLGREAHVTGSPMGQASPRGSAADRRDDVARLGPDGSDDAAGDDHTVADLIITSTPPENVGKHSADVLARLAAQLLRVGGILTVITHCDTSRGELVDPTGTVVTAAQNVDLLYLQHVVVLNAAVQDGRLVVDPTPSATEAHNRARHRAAVRGLPTPHYRVHSDVLVFARQHDNRTRIATALETGVIR